VGCGEPWLTLHFQTETALKRRGFLLRKAQFTQPILCKAMTIFPCASLVSRAVRNFPVAFF
jgi:hypothetical protein